MHGLWTVQEERPTKCEEVHGQHQEKDFKFLNSKKTQQNHNFLCLSKKPESFSSFYSSKQISLITCPSFPIHPSVSSIVKGTTAIAAQVLLHPIQQKLTLRFGDALPRRWTQGELPWYYGNSGRGQKNSRPSSEHGTVQFPLPFRFRIYIRAKPWSANNGRPICSRDAAKMQRLHVLHDEQDIQAQELIEKIPSDWTCSAPR